MHCTTLYKKIFKKHIKFNLVQVYCAMINTFNELKIMLNLLIRRLQLVGQTKLKEFYALELNYSTLFYRMFDLMLLSLFCAFIIYLRFLIP